MLPDTKKATHGQITDRSVQWAERIPCEGSITILGLTLSPPSPRRNTACISCRSRRDTDCFRPTLVAFPDSPRLPIQPFLNVRRTPLFQCLQQARRSRANTQRPILGHIAEKGTAGSCDRQNEPQDVPKSCFVASGARS